MYVVDWKESSMTSFLFKRTLLAPSLCERCERDGCKEKDGIGL